MAMQMLHRTMALLALTSLLACVPPGPQPPLPPSPLSTVRLYNASSETVCYVYISPATSSDLGTDLLGADVLPAGAQRTFSLPPGTYDLRAEDCQRRVLDVQYNIEVTETYEWQIPPAGPSPSGEMATVILENGSGQTICYAYMDILSGGDWTDQLGTDVIPPGEVYTFTLPAGIYDIALEDCDHNRIAAEPMVPISGVYYWSVPGTSDVTLTLINNSGQTVCYVYLEEISIIDSGQIDRLGQDVVPDGGTYRFRIPAGRYDMLAADCGHNDIDRRWGVEISGDYTWTINP